LAALGSGLAASQYASLRNQIFRAVASIPANIAEGRRQNGEKQFARFLQIALNSASELEYHLILAHDTATIPEDQFVSMLDQTITVRKMLYGLLKRLAASTSTTTAQAVEPDRSRPRARARSRKAAPRKAASR
jgi:four helix bundle protein